MTRGKLTTGTLADFRLEAFDDDGAAWDLTGHTVTLALVDPGGTRREFTATVAAGVASYKYLLPAGGAGVWRAGWLVIDPDGEPTATEPIPFAVAAAI
jgi:hypothetical protein